MFVEVMRGKAVRFLAENLLEHFSRQSHFQLMKLTQNPCRIRLPKMKSANALSELIFLSSISSPLTPSIVFVVVFFAAVEAPVGGRSDVCIRNEAVRTN